MSKIESEYIFKKDLDKYDNEPNIWIVSEQITDFDNLRYLSNLNKANEKDSIIGFFSVENQTIGFTMLLKYNRSQIKKFDLPDNTYEICYFFIFDPYRGQGWCPKIIKKIIDDFPEFNLKLTYETDNIPASKCYLKYFETIDCESNIEFLKSIWNSKSNFETAIHYSKD